MTIIETKLDGAYIIKPDVFEDERGWFMETYCRKKMPQIICDFVQDMQAYTAQKGTIRGIHFQHPPFSQAKLVRCTHGVIMDFAVDLRPLSKTFKQWIGVELSAENKKQLFIPHGFGHAYLTLTSDAGTLYKVVNYYSPEHFATILWADPEIGIPWNIAEPILSDRDKFAPLLKSCF